MQKRPSQTDDAAILRLKAHGASFGQIAQQLDRSIGSVTGRYYRLKGIRHPAQLKRDADLKRRRVANRVRRKRNKTIAAFKAAIAINSGGDFVSIIADARRHG
jgi:hypothetical protein